MFRELEHQAAVEIWLSPATSDPTRTAVSRLQHDSLRPASARHLGFPREVTIDGAIFAGMQFELAIHQPSLVGHR